MASHQLQQPMYVNMHELASLAASKAQEMLPLPPPPPSSEEASITSAATNMESKVLHLSKTKCKYCFSRLQLFLNA